MTFLFLKCCPARISHDAEMLQIFSFFIALLNLGITSMFVHVFMFVQDSQGGKAGIKILKIIVFFCFHS